jgi:hypothetical protein
MAAKNAVVFGNTNGTLNGWQRFNFLFIQRLGVAQQIDFRQPLAGTLNLVYPQAHARQVFQIMHGLPVGIAVQRSVGVKNG